MRTGPRTVRARGQERTERTNGDTARRTCAVSLGQVGASYARYDVLTPPSVPVGFKPRPWRVRTPPRSRPPWLPWRTAVGHGPGTPRGRSRTDGEGGRRPGRHSPRR